MSHDELSAQALAELQALDAILAREPVAEEHLELAALVDSVRGGAPKMSAEFSERLSARFQERGRRPARARSSAPRHGSWAFAGGGVVAAAVALAIVLSGSLRHDLFGGGGSPPVAASPFTKSVPHNQARNSVGPRQSFGAAPTTASPDVRALAGPRLVAKGSSLVLATPPAQISALASRIVSATEDLGGVVESSNVTAQGRSSYASFALTVPSGRLGRLISRLSALASVHALHQATRDITNPYRREQQLLARRQTQLRHLRAQLAVAASATAEANLRKQIHVVTHAISIERATLARLGREASNANLAVQVVPGAAARKHGHVTGTLGRAYHDALRALQEILAIALIVFAIVLPFALCALALWWASLSLRRRARDRAIGAA